MTNSKGQKIHWVSLHLFRACTYIQKRRNCLPTNDFKTLSTALWQPLPLFIEIVCYQESTSFNYSIAFFFPFKHIFKRNCNSNEKLLFTFAFPLNSLDFIAMLDQVNTEEQLP